MPSIFETLAYSLSQHKQLKVQATKTALLVNFPVDRVRRQTVKVTARSLPGLAGPTIVARVVSRAGFFEHHTVVRQVLEFNAGKQRPSLMLSDETDPPAIDVVYCEPIDIYNEEVGSQLWKVIREVGLCADNLEKQFGVADEL